MDTISRDNNSSYLPVAGLIVGLLGLILSGVALAKVSTTNKAIATQGTELGAKIDDAGSQARKASTDAANATASANKLAGDMQTVVNQIGVELGSIKGEVLKMQETSKPKAPGPGKTGPVVAAPGEYIVKAGDTSGTKIAKANGVSIGDLQAVNPGVDWSKLKIGQKLKLPKK